MKTTFFSFLLSPFCFFLSFCGLGIWLLMVELPEYVHEAALLTPFYTDRLFAWETIGKVGGLLVYVASFLSALGCLPLVGCVCLLLLLSGLANLIRRVFHIGSAVGLSWLVSLLLLLCYTQTGYMVYVLKVPAVGFLVPLGVFAAIGLFAVYRGMRSLWAKGVYLFLIAGVGYYALGCYALYALMLIAISEGRKSMALLSMGLAVLGPWVMYVCGWLYRRKEEIYTIGLPDYQWTEGEWYLWMPILFALFVPVCLLVFRKCSFMYVRMSSAVLFVFVAGWIYGATFRDVNFLAILDMKHAVERGDWKRVTEIAKESLQTPTRLQVLYTRLALYKLGLAGEQMFAFPDGDAPYNAPREHQYLRLIGGRTLYYHYGKVNYSYRWCMEDMVEYGRRPDYLRYMMKCADINQELVLAEKYDDALQGSMIPEEMRTRPRREEAEAVRQLMNYENMLDGDGGLIEVFLLNSFASMEGGTRPMVELSLQSCMIQKDIRGFWQRFLKLLPTFSGRIPTHYQEAVLLFATLGGRVDTGSLPIDPQIRKRFEKLVKVSEANARMGDDYNKRSLQADYGDTYWYYYFFVKGLKTN